MAFDEKFINELKEKNNIVDVVGKYCVLKKRGNVNYWACCPLPGHSEKTPSFSISSAAERCRSSGSKYSSEKSPSFVNGILAAYKKQLEESAECPQE